MLVGARYDAAGFVDSQHRTKAAARNRVCHPSPLPTCHRRRSAQYDARRRASPDPDVRPIVERSVKEAGVLERVFGGKPPK